jgi:Mce-associated membrane protein
VLRRTVIPLIAVVVVLSVVAAGFWHSARQIEARERAGAEAVAAATAAARAIFSYDHRSFGASVSNGASFTTGEFADEYARTTGTLEPMVLSEEAVVRAEVSAAGVVDAGRDRVEVLLYLNQFRSNVNIDGEKVDQNRVVLTMVRTGDGWKVAHADAI